MKRFGKLGASDLSELCSQLGTFLCAGVPLSKGLELMRNEAGSRRMKRAAETLANGVESGKTLSAAMSDSDLFPDYLIQMTNAGEVSGELDKVMESMAHFYEREQRLREQIRSALVYPLLLIAMMCVIVFFIITRMLPMFQDILNGLGGELPGFVLGLMGYGRFLENNGIIILAAIVLIFLLFHIAKNTTKGGYFLDRCKAAFPICRRLAAARFSSAMSFLLPGGFSMDRALALGRDMLGNTYMAQRLDACLKEIPKGETAAGVLRRADIFPEKFTAMFSVGFESGESEIAMEKLAEIYEIESGRSLERLAGSIEPILSAVLSVIVVVVLASVILPLIRVVSLIG